MNQAGILQPYGWFLDLETPNLRWTTDVPLNYSGDWVVSLFTRNLDVVEWINLDTVKPLSEVDITKSPTGRLNIPGPELQNIKPPKKELAK